MKLFDWLFRREPRVFAISDLHFASRVNKPMDVFGGEWPGYEKKIEKDWKKRVRKNDIVVVAGDISWGITLEEALPDLIEISKFGGKIVFCRGNHDYWWKSVSKIREAIPDNMFLLQNDALKLGNFVFCGTRGWKQAERGKQLSDEDAKILAREEQRMMLALAAGKKLKQENDKLFVVMHYPPTNSRLDDSAFTKMFEENNVDAVIFGHLHGKVRKTLSYKKGKTNYFLTSCDQVGNRLVKIK